MVNFCGRVGMGSSSWRGHPDPVASQVSVDLFLNRMPLPATSVTVFICEDEDQGAAVAENCAKMLETVAKDMGGEFLGASCGACEQIDNLWYAENAVDPVGVYYYSRILGRLGTNVQIMIRVPHSGKSVGFSRARNPLEVLG